MNVFTLGQLLGLAAVGLLFFGGWLCSRLFVRKPVLEHCAWRPGRLLIEPGISDMEHGRWARREFTCARCGAVRPMWQSVDLSSVREECPSR